MERIPAETWRDYRGHVKRYLWAASLIAPHTRVNDIACGTGYASLLLPHADYRGYDKPGVPRSDLFPGLFAGCDIDDPAWVPRECDVTCCFETLEHAGDPAALAKAITATTRRAVFVSVPVIPTVHCNEFHRTDFTEADIPPLFPGFTVADSWAQPEETSHVWMFTRA
jgi:SAM-dependent methyltransferase